jgi:predicted enzyme related to lactoylglutathione lyase
MINYVVQNMDALLIQLESQGVMQVKPMEDHEYGKFAWINDINGNRIELWEPK